VSPNASDLRPGSPDVARNQCGGGPAIAGCGSIAYMSTFTEMPAPDGAHYTRCESLGPETGTRAAIAPDTSRVAVITSAGTVRLFATNPWGEIAQLAAPLGRIDAAAFSPDSATLATISPEMGIVTLWRASDGQRGQTYTAARPAFMPDHDDSALAFTPDGRKLATSLSMLIDLDTGTTSPLSTVDTTLHLAFAPGDAALFEHAHFRIGNSPPTTVLARLDAATGAKTDLFRAYDRALLSHALSADHALLAFTQTEEAGEASLREYRIADGALVASVAGFTGTVLGYSPDGARLYTWKGGIITALDPTNLHALGAAAVGFTPDAFLAVSPDDHLVTSAHGVTTWTNPSTGVVARAMTHALTAASWSSEGRYGVGAGDAMFVFWRDTDARPLCTPAPIGGTAPAMSSLGTVLDADSSITSQDRSTTVTSAFNLHTHGTNYYDITVTDTATGAQLRHWPASIGRQLSMAEPDAAELYTLENSDTAVAGWCR